MGLQQRRSITYKSRDRSAISFGSCYYCYAYSTASLCAYRAIASSTDSERANVVPKPKRLRSCLTTDRKLLIQNRITNIEYVGRRELTKYSTVRNPNGWSRFDDTRDSKDPNRESSEISERGSAANVSASLFLPKTAPGAAVMATFCEETRAPHHGIRDARRGR